MIKWSEEPHPTWMLHRGKIDGKTIYRVRVCSSTVAATLDSEEGMSDRHRPSFTTLEDAKHWCEIHYLTGAGE